MTQNVPIKKLLVPFFCFVFITVSGFISLNSGLNVIFSNTWLEGLFKICVKVVFLFCSLLYTLFIIYKFGNIITKIVFLDTTFLYLSTG